MRTLSIDIETYSPVDIRSAGAYKYAEEVEIILFAYAFDNEPVTVIDTTKDSVPGNVLEALTDPTILKKAFNAAFERACISEFYFMDLPPEQWECTMIRSAMCGLPLSLEESARVLRLVNQKDTAGKALIRLFCVPCKPTKTNGMRTRNLPQHFPEKWNAFIEYCRQDVEVERSISEKLAFFPISDEERELWCLDQRINERGVLIDRGFAQTAIELDLAFRERLTSEACEITGLSNPNSVAQLKEWLTKETETEITSLKKGDLPKMLTSVDSEAAKRIVQLRIELSKTSVKKYTAMINAAGRDNRVRGILQHYGASRTGRWSGRLIQVQNLPRGEFKNIEVPRELVRAGDAELLEMCYGAIPDTLSSLIRSTLIPAKGKKLFISDFSAIEARVIAWVAGEQWRIDVFNTHGKIYEASAAQMFKVPLESIGKDSPLRQKGKVAELALGYQGGPNALLKMGALDMGIAESELKGLVDAWRGANKKIVAFWKTVNSAAINTLRTGDKTSIGKGMFFSTARGWLFLTLPSGRKLSYPNAGLEEGEYGDKIIYWGMNQTTKKWCKIDSYGGKFVENLVQAIARDCLAFGLLNVAKAGYTIIMHVHDEVVCEDTNGSIEEVNALLAQNPDWAEGLPLKAEGCESYYYKK